MTSTRLLVTDLPSGVLGPGPFKSLENRIMYLANDVEEELRIRGDQSARAELAQADARQAWNLIVWHNVDEQILDDALQTSLKKLCLHGRVAP